MEMKKIILVLKGKILDVVVDCRKKSKTFGKHFKIRLTSKDTGRQIDLNCLFEKAVLANEENE